MNHFERNFVKDCFVVVLLLDGKRNEKEKNKGCVPWKESSLIELVPTGWCGSEKWLEKWWVGKLVYSYYGSQIKFFLLLFLFFVLDKKG